MQSQYSQDGARNRGGHGERPLVTEMHAGPGTFETGQGDTEGGIHLLDGTGNPNHPFRGAFFRDVKVAASGKIHDLPQVRGVGAQGLGSRWATKHDGRLNHLPRIRRPAGALARWAWYDAAGNRRAILRHFRWP